MSDTKSLAWHGIGSETVSSFGNHSEVMEGDTMV